MLFKRKKIFNKEQINDAINYIEQLSKDEVNISDNNPVGDFYKYLHDNNITDYNYLKHYDSIKEKEYNDMAKKELITMFTFLERTDRFNGGIGNLKTSELLPLLKRLRDITK